MFEKTDDKKMLATNYCFAYRTDENGTTRKIEFHTKHHNGFNLL